MIDQLLTPEQIAFLEKLADTSASLPEQRRARILLLYHAGNETRQIAEIVGLSERSVQRWRREFLQHGIDIFSKVGNWEKGLPQPSSVETPETTSFPKRKTQNRAPVEVQYPRVRKNPGIKADDSMAEAGRKTLNFHFARMVAHEEGTRLGTDIEELHDMRVATRRMRAALDVFSPYYRPKVVKAHVRGLRATGRALGRVRDLDVFMEKAQQYLEALPEGERLGLEPLLAAWTEKRLTNRDKMLAYLDSETYREFKRGLNEFVSTPGAGVRSAADDNASPNLVRHMVPVLVYRRLAAVRAYESIVAKAVIEQLHALRITFKELRYTLEYFREVLGDEAGQVIEVIKGLQDHLGDLNDTEVACQILRQFIDTWEERQIDLPLQERKNLEPVVAYLGAKHSERHNLMVGFPEAWANFNRPEIRKNLALAVSVL